MACAAMRDGLRFGGAPLVVLAFELEFEFEFVVLDAGVRRAVEELAAPVPGGFFGVDVDIVICCMECLLCFTIHLSAPLTRILSGRRSRSYRRTLHVTPLGGVLKIPRAIGYAAAV